MRGRICSNCGGKQYKLVGQNMVKCCFCGSLYVNEEASREEEVLLVGVRELLRCLKFEEALQEVNNLLMLFPYSFEGYFLKALAKNKIVIYRNKAGTKSYPVCFDEKGADLLQDKHFNRSIELSPQEVAKSRLELGQTLKQLLAKVETDETKCDVVFLSAGGDENVLKTKKEILEKCKEKNIVVFEYQDRFKSYDAKFFNAIKTAKAFVAFAAKENVFSDASRKMAIDAYRNQILQQKKAASSLILACEPTKISVEKLPEELLKTKNIVDLGQQTCIEDFFAVLTNEMKKTGKEQVKLDRTEIVAQTPQKKEYVDVESVEMTELGHYAVENVELDQQNKIKWIFLMLKNQDFENAKPVVQQQLQEAPNDARLLVAQLMIDKQIATKEQFFESATNFDDKEKIEKILTYADKEFAQDFVDNWEKLLIRLNSTELFNKFLLFLAKFETANREKFIEAAQNKAIETQNAELVEKVEKCFDAKDVDRFIDFYFSLAQKSDDKTFYNKILELDVGHEASNHFVLLEHFKTTQDILTYRDKEEIGGAFKYLSPKARAKFVELVVGLVLPVAFKNLEEAQAQIDFYLSYLTNEEVSLLLKKIYKSFCEMSFFKVAEKYVAIAISFDKTNAMLYWELIKIKAHCKTDQDVVLSNISFAKLPEWQTFLSFASEEEADSCAKWVSKSNLYKGEKKAFADDMRDAVLLKEKLNAFLSRNGKILQEFEKEGLVDAGRGVQYFKLQLQPFEKVLKKVDEVANFDDYCDLVHRLQLRLDAIGLSLDSSVKASMVQEKNSHLKGIVESVEETKANLKKVISHEKKKTTAKRLAFWLLCVLPLMFTTTLLGVFIFMPKEVYMKFSQEFLIEFSIASVVYGFAFLMYFLKIKKDNQKTKAKIASLSVSIIGFLNIFLFAVGMVFIPKTITISNTKEFFALIKNANSASLCLECDIDLQGVEWEDGDFYGTFDGRGFVIKNIKFKDGKNVGFFRLNAGVVKNLNLRLADKTYKKVKTFGGVACNNKGKIENCAIEGTVQIDSDKLSTVGGFVGHLVGGKVISCVNNIEMQIETNSKNVVVGGFVGKAAESGVTITKNINLSKIKLQTNQAENVCVGGLVGVVEKIETAEVDISQNANEVNFVALGEVKNLCVGALAGKSKSQIENSYSNGAIDIQAQTQTALVGGLVGEFISLDHSGKIEKCFSLVEISCVEGVEIGRLVGSLGGVIKNCFTNQQGNLFAKTYPYAKQEVCLTLVSKFYDSTLDFDTQIWQILSSDYPKLKLQN